jgi:hypothetical protein
VSQAGNWTHYPLTTLPARYDIVLCRYPEVGAVEPGPKCRPALVRTTAVMDDTGEGEVEVVYGTKVLKLGRRSLDLHVTNVQEMNWAGLFHPTRFDLDKAVWLPWAEEFFVPGKGKVDPILGALSPYMIQKLQEQYAYKQHFQQLRLELEEAREPPEKNRPQ